MGVTLRPIILAPYVVIGTTRYRVYSDGRVLDAALEVVHWLVAHGQKRGFLAAEEVVREDGQFFRMPNALEVQLTGR